MLTRLGRLVHRDGGESLAEAPLHRQRFGEGGGRAREQSRVAARRLYQRLEARLGLARTVLVEQKTRRFEPRGGRVGGRRRRAVLRSARVAAGYVRTLRHLPVESACRFLIKRGVRQG